ncbi:MAG TPA: hypothetical protein VGJ00_04800, partial [Rhabdochlamydiaceae bacterium]
EFAGCCFDDEDLSFYSLQKDFQRKAKNRDCLSREKTLAGGTSDCMDAKKVPKTCCQMGTKN